MLNTLFIIIISYSISRIIFYILKYYNLDFNQYIYNIIFYLILKIKKKLIRLVINNLPPQGVPSHKLKEDIYPGTVYATTDLVWFPASSSPSSSSSPSFIFFFCRFLLLLLLCCSTLMSLT